MPSWFSLQLSLLVDGILRLVNLLPRLVNGILRLVNLLPRLVNCVVRFSKLLFGLVNSPLVVFYCENRFSNCGLRFSKRLSPFSKSSSRFSKSVFWFSKSAGVPTAAFTNSVGAVQCGRPSVITPGMLKSRRLRRLPCVQGGRVQLVARPDWFAFWAPLSCMGVAWRV